MTRLRRDGNDSPFSAWIRSQGDLDSKRDSCNVHDIDYMIHRYRANVDNFGTRNFQLLMCVEVKTHNANPSDNQSELLFYHHQLLRNADHKDRQGKPECNWLRRIGRPPVLVRHYGYYVLKLPGDRPDDNDFCSWGRFEYSGKLKYALVTEKTLIDILSFRVDPYNIRKKIEFRRHHARKEILEREVTPLGFEVDKLVVYRS